MDGLIPSELPPALPQLSIPWEAIAPRSFSGWRSHGASRALRARVLTKKRCKFKSWLVMVGSAASANISLCLLASLVLGIGIRSAENQSFIRHHGQP